MKVTRVKRPNIGGLIKFRLSLRYSRTKTWHCIELWNSHNCWIIEFGERPHG